MHYSHKRALVGVALIATLALFIGGSVFAQTAAAPTDNSILIPAMKFSKEEKGAVKAVSGRVGANGDSMSTWNNSGHVVEWTFTAPADGLYKVVFRYAGGRSWTTYRDFKIDGKSPGADFDKIAFPATGGFAKDSNDWANLTVADAKGAAVLVKLTKGSHVIRMNNLGGDSGDGAANFDTIALLPKDADTTKILGKVTTYMAKTN